MDFANPHCDRLVRFHKTIFALTKYVDSSAWPLSSKDASRLDAVVKHHATPLLTSEPSAISHESRDQCEALIQQLFAEQAKFVDFLIDQIPEAKAITRRVLQSMESRLKASLNTANDAVAAAKNFDVTASHRLHTRFCAPCEPENLPRICDRFAVQHLSTLAVFSNPTFF
jgi:hypothetical protein